MTNAEASTGASLELDQVTVSFGAQDVLRGLSLRVRPGEQVALVGPSGAGKTTLLRLFNATVRPRQGRVLLDGQSLPALRGRELRRARAGVGFVHQDHALVPNLRVNQNVAMGRLGRQGFLAGLRSVLWSSRRDLAAMHALLARVGIEHKLFQRVDSLSGGQQQRVAIARALWQRPGLLLADEPVASVDPARSRDVIRLLLEVAEERGLTLFVSLHDLELARELFPRVIGLRDGEVAIDAAPNEVPEQSFTELYSLEQRGDFDLPEEGGAQKVRAEAASGPRTGA